MEIMEKKTQSLHLDNYTSRQRWVESACLLTFALLCLTAFVRIGLHWSWEVTWMIATGFLLGLVAADFVSGFVHWAADTWGTVEMPILGPTLIRSFREHHVDQAAITRHDFVETNGASSMVCLPVLFASLFLPLREQNKLIFFLANAILFFSIFILLTNQIHKWSHSREIPWLVSLFQNSGLILSPQHHRMHHQPPYDRYYCITTGWLNPILSGIRFFRIAEFAITKTTGAIPREDDQRLLNLKKNGGDHDPGKRAQSCSI